jgi:hypothetical protein
MSALDSDTIATLADDVIRWKLGTITRGDVKYCLEGADPFRELTDGEYETALDEIYSAAERKADAIGDDV